MKRSPDFFLGRADRVELLRGECERWLGTPFRQNSRVCGPGGGVDCANYMAVVFEFVDPLLGAIVVPGYEVNHAEHSSESQLRAWFERPKVRARVRLLDEDEPHLDGDFVFPEVGRCEHHIGTRIGQLVYHVVRGGGVCHMTLGQLKFHRSRYRLLEA